MKKIKVIMTFVMILCMPVYLIEWVFAAEEGIRGQVLVTITFTSKEAEAYKGSFDTTISEAVETLKDEISETNDDEKIKYLKKIIENTQNFDVDSLFKEQPDGSFVIQVPYRNAEIKINEKTYRIDEEGNYAIPNGIDLEKEETVTLIKEGLEIIDVQSDFSGVSGEKDIELVRTFNEFAQGMMDMYQGMKEAEGQAVTLVFFPAQNIGTYIGAGAGRTQIVGSFNIVVCNKHDTSTNSITKEQFAQQNSDCSKSVRLGLMYYASPVLYNSYWRSGYCTIEAVTNETGIGNVYCNGKLHSDGRYNCSWFTGINHAENFHIHKYK